MKKILKLKVNGREREVLADETELLIHVLRERLNLKGTKEGCGRGECGACTVLIDGKPVNSCLVLAVTLNGKEITTIEGIDNDGELHPVQKAFIDSGAVQCGYCTPGMVLAAKALLEENKKPSDEEIKHYLEGNLCRCTGYVSIIEAIKSLL